MIFMHYIPIRTICNSKQNAYSDPYKTKLNNLWNMKQIACGQTHGLFLQV